MKPLTGQPLVLINQAGDGVDVERWAHLLRVTWSRLPWRMTEDIGRHWKDKTPDLILTQHLESPLSPGKPCGGFAEPTGLRVFIDVDIVGPLSDKQIMTLICHELIHVANFAAAQLRGCPEGQWSERDCDRIGAALGFPMDALRRPQPARGR